MSIGIMALTFALACGVTSVCLRAVGMDGKQQEPRTFDYAALMPKEI